MKALDHAPHSCLNVKRLAIEIRGAAGLPSFIFFDFYPDPYWFVI